MAGLRRSRLRGELGLVERIYARDVGAAREEILNLIQRNININRTMTIIYWDGWDGFGRTGVLRSIADVLPSMKPYPPELRFDRTIYIDCSRWKNKRVMQRKIAEELKLDNETMALFDKQDEEDDFNGVDLRSRDAILNVSAAISRILSQSRFLMIFLNGSDDEIPLSTFGIADYSDCVVIWTWSRMFLTVNTVNSIYRKIKEGRYTDLFIYGYQDADKFSSSEFGALFREEAATIVGRCPCLQNIDLEIVADCCLYGFLMYYYNKQSRNEFVWPAHASNYWTCDGIIQGARALEVSNALHPEVGFECSSYELKRVVTKLKMDPKAPFLLLGDDNNFVYSNSNRPYRWVFAISNDTIEEAMQTKMASASSIFLATQMYLLGIPDGFFEQCSSLCVLVLSCCAFNFVSPLFLHCQTLKFIGLDRCKSNSTVELQGKWACLKNLRVIDLRYTDWVEIFHEEKMVLMANLMEVNIEGVRCSQLTSQLKKRLPCLERLRIINPVYEAEAETSSSTDINDLFVDKTDLQLLDLSGNKEMKNLPTSISNAGQLKVLILDGCDALEEVVVPNRLPSSLRSFSFDGYGSAAPSRASTIEVPLQSCRPVGPGMKDAKTSVISLEGCTQLDNLFLRRLPNLVELDLSGCAIKVLDFETMVTNVPCLKRLFLLGCEHLRAIRWGPNGGQSRLLELLCIDTRPARKVLGCARPSLAVEHKSFRLQVHACIVDARLARSLLAPSNYNCYFNISITSSMASSSSGVVQPEETSKKMTEPSDQKHYGVAGIYGDVFSKVGDAVTTMEAFPQPPTQQLDYHMEIGDGSHSVESEVKQAYESNNLVHLMAWYTESLHVHDDSTCRHALAAKNWSSLKWCRVERCSNLDVVFPQGADEYDHLEIIWASDLLKAHCIWSRGITSDRYLQSLQHLHLRSCPSLLPLLPQLENPPHHPLRRPQAHLCTGHGVPADKYGVPKTDHHPPTRLAVTAADMRGRRDGGARAGDHQDQRMLEPTPSAPQSRQAEAGHRGGERCVGRAGVGRGGRRPPPFPLPAAPAFTLQEQAHAQGHPPRI
uniref:NB-ARC domain-containing protein n=1 Tax=Oryza meridionalis TaxID=40149 RepID=A0A0E0ENA3_9ORYZ